MFRLLMYSFKLLLFDRKNVSVQLAGLVLGIVSCLMMFQYVLYEYSYDKFHDKVDLIYRTNGTCPLMLGPLAKDKVSYVVNFTRLHPVYRDAVIKSNTDSYLEKVLYYADSSLFSMFSFEVLQGDAKQALATRNSVVISERYAKKYFGDTNPIGNTLMVSTSYEDNQNYCVKAVFKNIPDNSHLKFDILLSIENILSNPMYSDDSPWKWSNFFTYFETNQKLPVESFTADLNKIAVKNGAEKFRTDPIDYPVTLLSDLHLNGLDNYMDSNKSVGDVFLWIYIAFIVLVVAWLNYINISVANIFKAKASIGIKKAMGAKAYDLWFEQLFKALITNFVAISISFCVVSIVSPYFQDFFGIPIRIPNNYRGYFWVGVALMLVTGSALSSYISNYTMTKDTVVQLFSKHSEKRTSRYSPWAVSLIAQFTISIVLICFAFLTTKQTYSIISTKSNINIDNVLAIHSARITKSNSIDEDRMVFEEKVLDVPGVKVSSSATYLPGMFIPSNMNTVLLKGSREQEIPTRMNFVGYDYLNLFEHHFLSGRNFSKSYSTDNDAVIINKKLAAMYGFKNAEEAIGKEIYWPIRDRKKVIIGVVDNFFQQSAEKEIDPLMFHLWNNASGYCILKLENKNYRESFQAIQGLWNRIHPNNPFEYIWVDALYDKQFTRWIQFSQMAATFSVMAILIACIGLFGLTSLVMAKRTKEIGIRKVNGAKIWEVMAMLNIDFVKWVSIAFVIATPIAWYAMNRWLQNFAYRTEINWWIFALAGAVALCVAILTVSWQSWNAARRNPVEALRYE